MSCDINFLSDHFSFPYFPVWVSSSYLEIIFLVDGESVREDIACNNHVGLVSIHGEPVNPQKLRQQRVAMALHDELRKDGRNIRQSSDIPRQQSHTSVP